MRLCSTHRRVSGRRQGGGRPELKLLQRRGVAAALSCVFQIKRKKEEDEHLYVHNVGVHSGLFLRL